VRSEEERVVAVVIREANPSHGKEGRNVYVAREMRGRAHEMAKMSRALGCFK
jgi:hypothetical protein